MRWSTLENYLFLRKTLKPVLLSLFFFGCLAIFLTITKIRPQAPVKGKVLSEKEINSEAERLYPGITSALTQDHQFPNDWLITENSLITTVTTNSGKQVSFVEGTIEKVFPEEAPPTIEVTSEKGAKGRILLEDTTTNFCVFEFVDTIDNLVKRELDINSFFKEVKKTKNSTRLKSGKLEALTCKLMRYV